MNGYVIFSIIVVLWIIVVYFLHKRGILGKYNMTASGPFIMWKTQKGREFIERVSCYARLWRRFGDAAIWVCAVTMILFTLMLLWTATLVSRIPGESAPTPEMLIGIPGINPLIPVWYGIVSLAISIVIHELMHGILARSSETKIPVKSLGVLLFILPIGAFVEPDEDNLKAMPRRQRARLFAAGPAVNILLALLFAFIFSGLMMSNVSVAREGVGITDVVEGSPAAVAGLQPGMIIVAMDSTQITSAQGFHDFMMDTKPGQVVNVTTYYRGSVESREITLEVGDEGRGRLGVYSINVSVGPYRPFDSPEEFGGYERALLTYISLPFQRLSPIQEPLTDFYTVEGPWASVPAPAFWILANLVYWLFWLNLMLGATNSLPAIPLDGGYIFKDGVESLVTRFRAGMKKEEVERTVKSITYAVALAILALVLWQLIGPRIF